MIFNSSKHCWHEEVKKLTVVPENYLKKTKFCKVSSYLQVLATPVGGGNYVHRYSCPRNEGIISCSYAVTLRLLVNCCCLWCSRWLCVRLFGISALRYLMPSSAFLDGLKYHLYHFSLSRVETSVSH